MTSVMNIIKKIVHIEIYSLNPIFLAKSYVTFNIDDPNLNNKKYFEKTNDKHNEDTKLRTNGRSSIRPLLADF